MPLQLHFKQKLVANGREGDKNTNYRFVQFLPNAYRKFQTNNKKIQKIIKYYYGFLSSQNKEGNADKWRK